ncbi:hypothetical protein C7M84_020806 [Penaeus vannamei]|uniref:Uncharacterized protein n=1 Tax=Penaeus vannamei TaxID=6689 RepID=A0A423SB24_PENVA|nr:hypothetical protein C7M84_020806 [Penaeus vannamei]
MAGCTHRPQFTRILICVICQFKVFWSYGVSTRIRPDRTAGNRAADKEANAKIIIVSPLEVSRRRSNGRSGVQTRSIFSLFFILFIYFFHWNVSSLSLSPSFNLSYFVFPLLCVPSSPINLLHVLLLPSPSSPSPFFLFYPSSLSLSLSRLVLHLRFSSPHFSLPSLSLLTFFSHIRLSSSFSTPSSPLYLPCFPLISYPPPLTLLQSFLSPSQSPILSSPSLPLVFFFFYLPLPLSLLLPFFFFLSPHYQLSLSFFAPSYSPSLFIVLYPSSTSSPLSPISPYTFVFSLSPSFSFPSSPSSLASLLSPPYLFFPSLSSFLSLDLLLHPLPLSHLFFNLSSPPLQPFPSSLPHLSLFSYSLSPYLFYSPPPFPFLLLPTPSPTHSLLPSPPSFSSPSPPSYPFRPPFPHLVLPPPLPPPFSSPLPSSLSPTSSPPLLPSSFHPPLPFFLFLS